MDSTYDLQQDMETFIRSIGTSDQEKVASASTSFIASKLRERSFVPSIIAPRTVTRGDLQIGLTDDQMYLIDEKEVPTAPCTFINFKAEPDNKYITVPRYTIAIQQLSTPVYAKKEIELLAINQPVVKILEDNLVRELDRTWDTKFLEYAVSAADNSEVTSTVTTTNSANVSTTGGLLTRGAVNTLRHLITRHQLPCAKLLMSQETWETLDVQSFGDVGSPLQSETFVDGYKKRKVLGYDCIVSIKNDLFLNDDGDKRVWAFTDEKALGRFIILENLRFAMRRVWDTIEFKGWLYQGMGFGNNNGVAYVDLVTA